MLLDTWLQYLAFLPLCVYAGFWNGEDESPKVKRDTCPPTFAAVCPETHAISRRQNEPTINLPGVNAGIDALIGVTAGIGNINITIGNITVETGNLTLEDITIGNISVLVSLQLTGQSMSTPIAIASTAASSATTTAEPPATTTGADGSVTTLSTVSVTSGATPAVVRRQALPAPTVNPGPGIGINAGVNANAAVSVGNVTLTVNNIFVRLGSITLSNITIGNIDIRIFVGTPNLGPALTNLTGTLGNAAGGVVGALGG